MAEDLMAKMSKSYRIEVVGAGPFFGVIVAKKNNAKYRCPTAFATDSAAVLAARAFLTGMVKKGKLPA